jgi:hypothetical protein
LNACFGSQCTASSSKVDGSAPVGAGIPPGHGLIFAMPISEDEVEAAIRKIDAIRQVVSQRRLPMFHLTSRLIHSPFLLFTKSKRASEQ